MLYKQLGSKLGQAAVWSALAQVHAYNGNLHGALKFARNSLQLYERLDHLPARTNLMRRLGGLCMFVRRSVQQRFERGRVTCAAMCVLHATGSCPT